MLRRHNSKVQQDNFVPMAISHFERACNLAGFCSFFLERSRLHYARFAFDMYTRVTGLLVDLYTFFGAKKTRVCD